MAAPDDQTVRSEAALVRRYRMLVNAWPWVLGGIGFVFLGDLVGVDVPSVVPPPLILLMALAFVAWVISYVVLSFAFSWHGIRCPSCRAPFAPGLSFIVPESCAACGYNVGSRKGE